MADEYAIEVDNISKSFKLPHEKQTSLKGALINFRKRGFEKQEVLRNISFKVRRGQFFGVVGRNGSGKSTLLKLLAGIYTPDSGQIRINGGLTPFIELGVGFNPELTGRENVFLNGALLGFNRKEMHAMYDEIVQFAELERFMDQKLKNYSSGMQVRLAFSIAIRADTEILILDEVLAVGDSNFQKKCFDTFRDIKKAGKTVILVTHDMRAVENFCDKALLLKAGEILTIGSSAKVAKEYNQENVEAFSEQIARESHTPAPSKGYSPAKILSTDMKTLDGKSKKTAYAPKEPIIIEVSCQFYDTVASPIVGITLKDRSGQRLFDTNTRVTDIKTGLCGKGLKITVRFEIQNILSDGKYFVHAAIANQDATIFYDIDDEAAVFTTGGWKFPSALVQPTHTVTLRQLS